MWLRHWSEFIQLWTICSDSSSNGKSHYRDTRTVIARVAPWCLPVPEHFSACVIALLWFMDNFQVKLKMSITMWHVTFISCREAFVCLFCSNLCRPSLDWNHQRFRFGKSCAVHLKIVFSCLALAPLDHFRPFPFCWSVKWQSRS